MDFQRATLNAFFYDYPLGVVFGMLKGDTVNIEDILKPLPGLMSLRFPAFNIGEYRLWVEMLKNGWGKEIDFNDGVLLPFMLLFEYGNQFLNLPNLVVKNGQLLRWHELTNLLSEDLVICSSLAKYDVDNLSLSSKFDWKESLDYDNNDCQSIIESGLIDLHAHLDASSDAFNIGWIDRMNRFNIKRGAKIDNYDEKLFDDIKIISTSQDCSVDYWRKPYIQVSYMDWVSLAALLRYHIYRIACDDKFPTTKEMADIDAAITDTSFAKYMLWDLYTNSDSLRRSGHKVNEKNFGSWDYALSADCFVGNNMTTPESLLAGERWLLYSYFKKLYKNSKERQIIKSLPMVYLYILIKLRARREVVQTNRLKGLANYQQYQKNYKSFVSEDTQVLHWKYAVQTSILEKRNHFECRVSPQNISEVKSQNFEKPLLTSDTTRSLTQNGSLSFVCSISKSTNETETREFLGYRERLKKGLDEVLQIRDADKKTIKRHHKIVGLDFTGSDRKMRPELYGQLVRYARHYGIKHFTYHAGEDFFDLLDGIRTIDEVIYHLNWNKNCRIAHALSLFTDTEQYYKKRHFKCFMPGQVMLDNLVWLSYVCKKIGLTVDGEFNSQIDTLYCQIGYPIPFDFKSYVASMKLRGDNINRHIENQESPYAKCSERKDTGFNRLRRNTVAKEILRCYVMDKDIFRRGNKMVEWKYPIQVIEIAKRMQDYTIGKMKAKGISIETCPTSNLTIGHFDRYISLPSIQLDNKGFIFNVNTDDKGILATSIENEYALLYAALQKEGKTVAEIHRYFNNVKSNAKKMRF